MRQGNEKVISVDHFNSHSSFVVDSFETPSMSGEVQSNEVSPERSRAPAVSNCPIEDALSRGPSEISNNRMFRNCSNINANNGATRRDSREPPSLTMLSTSSARIETSSKPSSFLFGGKKVVVDSRLRTVERDANRLDERLPAGKLQNISQGLGADSKISSATGRLP